MIVADASAVLELLLNSPRAQAVADLLFAEQQSIHVPHLIDLEVAQVMRRYLRTKTVSQQRAREALQDYFDMRFNRYPHLVLLERVWELRHDFTAYDAVYIALAEALAAPLITCDARLSSGHGAEVIVV